MNFRRGLYFVFLLVPTLIIVVRRFLWGQIPSQVPAVVVNITLALSFAAMARQIWLWYRPREKPAAHSNGLF